MPGSGSHFGALGWELVLQLKSDRGDCAQKTCAITPNYAIAAGPASETESIGSRKAIPLPTRSQQKPAVSGLDPHPWMRSLFESER